MFVIEIIARSSNDFDVLLYDPTNRFMQQYSNPHITALQTYIYVRGLVAVFSAGLKDITSSNAWHYISEQYSLSQRHN